MAANRERRRIRVTGVVQGVGFRPFVYGLAVRHGLSGFVLNDGEGVLLEAEGPPELLDAFVRGLAERGAAARARGVGRGRDGSVHRRRRVHDRDERGRPGAPR